MKSVHKFDGGCLSDINGLLRVAETTPAAPVVVVCSAISGTTDALTELTNAAAAGARDRVDALAEQIWARHAALGRSVGVSESTLLQLWKPVGTLAMAIVETGLVDPRLTDRILSTGEKLAAQLVAAALQSRGHQAVVHNADRFLATDAQFGAATPLRDVAYRTIAATLGPELAAGRTPVVTGFIGCAPDGATTTLGRSGADLTATVLAAALKIPEVTLWTDTAGLLSGDPAVVERPAVIGQLNYREAVEMSFYGTRLLHPRAMIPAQAGGVSVRIRSIVQPEQPGTVVDGQFTADDRPVKAVRAIAAQALLSVEGKGMAGVTGVSGRVFQALADEAISATMISQTGSEASICLAVDKTVAESGASAIKRVFRPELSRGEIEEVAVRRHAGLVAVVGLGMAHTPGVAATALMALADAGINILALAQGSSELNITIAVDEHDVKEAQRRLHTVFGLDAERPTAPAHGAGHASKSAKEPSPGAPLTTSLRPLTESASLSAVTDSAHPFSAETTATKSLDEVTAFAPATVANLGLGFDILGLALGEVGDRVVARRTAQPGVRIVSVHGDGGRLPRQADRNSAGVAGTATMRAAGMDIGVELELHKGLPLGSGLGSSAASAAAAAVAVNALMGNPLRPVELIPPCVLAEAAVSAAHADNVAPSLLGGLVLIRSLDPLDVIRLPLPKSLTVAVVTPDIEVNTGAAREVLPPSVSLPSLVRWTANIAALTCACFTSDLDLMARCITEDEVTASRAALIPGCRDVIQSAVNAGCLGSSISGSGPSVFALCRSPQDGDRVAHEMAATFRRHGLSSKTVVSRAERPGARIL